MEPFKIMTYRELRGERINHDDQPFDSKPTWRERIVNVFWPQILRDRFDLTTENCTLRIKLLNALKACEDAGRTGLALYAENEELRERLDTPADEKIARLHDVRRLEKENWALSDKLKRSNDRYNDLRAETDKLIAKFGGQE